jgi:hypothetical protein
MDLKTLHQRRSLQRRRPSVSYHQKVLSRVHSSYRVVTPKALRRSIGFECEHLTHIKPGTHLNPARFCNTRSYSDHLSTFREVRLNFEIAYSLGPLWWNRRNQPHTRDLAMRRQNNITQDAFLGTSPTDLEY